MHFVIRQTGDKSLTTVKHKDLVISPTLNERENIDILVQMVLAHDGFSLLIVDDDSGDGTWQRVEELQKEYPDLFLLRRMENHGFRNSYIDGFRWALQHSIITHIFTMDADLSHKPEYLPKLCSRLEGGIDMIVGSRYSQGGGVKNWTLPRKFLSRIANRFARFMTGLPVRDCTSGFNGIRTDALANLDLDSIKSNGYAFLIELKHLLWRNRAKLAEIPIIFTDRINGITKFNSGMIKEAVKACRRLRKMNKQTL